MTTHTPPWIAEVDVAPRWAITNGPKSLAVTVGGNDEANARHIVKCVNMHDELVEALRPFMLMPSPFSACSLPGCDCVSCRFLKAQIVAQAALAKADKGEA